MLKTSLWSWIINNYVFCTRIFDRFDKIWGTTGKKMRHGRGLKMDFEDLERVRKVLAVNSNMTMQICNELNNKFQYTEYLIRFSICVAFAQEFARVKYRRNIIWYNISDVDLNIFQFYLNDSAFASEFAGHSKIALSAFSIAT